MHIPITVLHVCIPVSETLAIHAALPLSWVSKHILAWAGCLLAQREPDGSEVLWPRGLCSGLASEKRVFPAVEKEGHRRPSHLVSLLVIQSRVLQTCMLSPDLVIQGCAAIRTQGKVRSRNI